MVVLDFLSSSSHGGEDSASDWRNCRFESCCACLCVFQSSLTFVFSCKRFSKDKLAFFNKHFPQMTRLSLLWEHLLPPSDQLWNYSTNIWRMLVFPPHVHAESWKQKVPVSFNSRGAGFTVRTFGSLQSLLPNSTIATDCMLLLAAWTTSRWRSRRLQCL